MLRTTTISLIVLFVSAIPATAETIALNFAGTIAGVTAPFPVGLIGRPFSGTYTFQLNPTATDLDADAAIGQYTAGTGATLDLNIDGFIDNAPATNYRVFDNLQSTNDVAEFNAGSGSILNVISLIDPTQATFTSDDVPTLAQLISLPFDAQSTIGFRIFGVSPITPILNGNITSASFSTVVIPEPASAALLALGTLLLVRRNRLA